MSSLGRTTTRAVRPWRRAFMLERTRPCGEVGPWDFSEFRRLAAYSRGDGICFSDSSFNTERLEIGLLENGCGRGIERLSTAGVEMAGGKYIFRICERVIETFKTVSRKAAGCGRQGVGVTEFDAADGEPTPAELVAATVKV